MSLHRNPLFTSALATAVLLGGCTTEPSWQDDLSQGWRDNWSAAVAFFTPNDAASPDAQDSAAFEGSLAAAMMERGIATTVVRPAAVSSAISARRPPLSTADAREGAAPQGTASPPDLLTRGIEVPQQMASSRPTPPSPRRSRVVSIPLSVADNAHAQGLLRRAALLNGTFGGGIIRLVPFGPDPERALEVAQLAARQLQDYGVPEQMLTIHNAMPTNLREARIDVWFEQTAP